MGKKNAIAILVIGVVLCGTALYLARGQTKPTIATNKHKPLATAQKVADFEYMYQILKDNFPYFAIEKQKTGYDWLSQHDRFVQEIATTKGDREFIYKINEILNLVQSGHTGLIPPSKVGNFKHLYVNFPVPKGKNGRENWYRILNSAQVNQNEYWQSIAGNSLFISPIAPAALFRYVEGRYVAEDYAGVEATKQGVPQGSILLEVNGVDPDTYVRSLMNKRYLQYDFMRKKLMLNHLIVALDQMSKTTIRVQTPSGTVLTRQLSAGKQEILVTKQSIDTRSLANNQVAYLKIPAMNEQPQQQETAEIRQFLQQVKNYPYLIIDIRGNGGGDTRYWVENLVQPLINKSLKQESYILFRGGSYIKPFLAEAFNALKPIGQLAKPENLSAALIEGCDTFTRTTLAVAPVNSVGFHGKIFLLVDDNVFSSAEAFASFAKSTQWATLVGTTTGGDGIGIDPAVAVLPNSGLVFRFPLDMGLNPDGTANEASHTKPDIYVEQSYQDFRKNLEWQKQHPNDSISPYDTVLNTTLSLCNR